VPEPTNPFREPFHASTPSGELTLVDLEPVSGFFSHVHLHGGPAPVRRFLPDLIDLIMGREIDPGRVFDLELPLTEAAEGYRAMDERRAIKTFLNP
jgi:threonine dehydrogenase-like Zn-dependent dehydrogenase